MERKNRLTTGAHGETSHVTIGQGGSDQSGARFRPMDPTDDIEVMRLNNNQDWSVDGTDLGSQSDSIAGLDDTKNKVQISKER